MPSALDCEPVSPSYGWPNFGLGVFAAKKHRFGVIWAFLRHINGDDNNGGRGQQKALCHEQAQLAAALPSVLLCLAVLKGSTKHFGQKMAVFGAELHRFGRVPPDLCWRLLPPLKRGIGQGHVCGYNHQICGRRQVAMME